MNTKSPKHWDGVTGFWREEHQPKPRDAQTCHEQLEKQVNREWPLGEVDHWQQAELQSKGVEREDGPCD